jgi:thiamine-monophosphate kinase
MIARIKGALSAGSGPGVRTGIGDDTAVLVPGPGALLLATTDLLVENVHFRRVWASPYDIGWKAMAVNLSDIAAMGGIPRWALVALALPTASSIAEVDAFYSGMQEAAAPHGVAIVGGDTSASADGWIINVTVLGEHHANPRLRSAAVAGDVVLVTGTLGRAAAGLALRAAGAARPASLSDRSRDELTGAHLRPVPRVVEGQRLAALPGVHAMMDMSDGLATDLGHICRESGVGARIQLDALPVAPATREAAGVLGKDPLEWATGGGEDYELLFTCEASGVDSVADELLRATGIAITVIGRIDPADTAVTYVDAQGEPVALRSGYQHFRG